MRFNRIATLAKVFTLVVLAVTGAIANASGITLVATRPNVQGLPAYTSYLNQAVTLTATVTGANPTGSVAFYYGGIQIGGAPIANSGTATAALSLIQTPGVFNEQITAVYSGDQNNSSATSSGTVWNVWIPLNGSPFLVFAPGTPTTIPSGVNTPLTLYFFNWAGTNETGTVQLFLADSYPATPLGSPVAFSSTTNGAIATATVQLTQGQHNIYALCHCNVGDPNTTLTITATSPTSAVPAMPWWALIGLMIAIAFTIARTRTSRKSSYIG